MGWAHVRLSTEHGPAISYMALDFIFSPAFLTFLWLTKILQSPKSSWPQLYAGEGRWSRQRTSVVGNVKDTVPSLSDLSRAVPVFQHVVSSVKYCQLITDEWDKCWWASPKMQIANLFPIARIKYSKTVLHSALTLILSFSAPSKVHPYLVNFG